MPYDLVVEHQTNKFKYPVMRELIYKKPVSTEWFIWFDDDSYVTDKRWLPKLEETIDKTYDDGGRLYGQIYRWDLRAGQKEWIEAAHWYRNKPFLTATKGADNVHTIKFPTGGYWAVPYENLIDLFWPDERIVHNGGDTMLGEAVRQQGYSVVGCHAHVKVNDGKRRGASTNPAGVQSRRIPRV